MFANDAELNYAQVKLLEAQERLAWKRVTLVQAQTLVVRRMDALVRNLNEVAAGWLAAVTGKDGDDGG